jgi:hypothetical protein
MNALPEGLTHETDGENLRRSTPRGLPSLT